MSDSPDKTEASAAPRSHDASTSTLPPPPAGASVGGASQSKSQTASTPRGQRRFTLDVGDIVDGKYKIEAIIGRGGMGVVVAAQHLQLKETVALKFLLSQADDEDEFRSRFLREAQVSAKLRGEHVTRLMDFGAPEGGPPFMVMEYLQGVDVRQAIKQNGPLPVEVAIDYIVQACEGLAEAHALGVVHRDLKPSNLFLSKRLDGTDLVKILDFGVSKMAGLKDVDDELTTAGSVLGSPRYMSPEQLRNSGDVDARADVWSLGAIFYEMLTGRAPFQAPSTAALCAKILGTDPIPPITAERPDVSAAIEHAAFKCLARERDQRTPDVSGFIADLALATNLPWVSAAVGRISAVLERRSTRGEGFSGSYPGLNSSSQQRALGPLSSPSAMAMADASSRSSKAAAPPPAKRPIVPIAIAAVLLLLGGGLLLTRKTPPVPAPAAPPPVASPATTPAPSAAPPPPATTEAKPTAPPSATATAGNDRSAPPGDPPRGKGGNGKKGAATPPPPGPTPPTPPPVTPPPRTNPLDDRF